jgi:hypothetical protein
MLSSRTREARSGTRIPALVAVANAGVPGSRLSHLWRSAGDDKWRGSILRALDVGAVGRHHHDARAGGDVRRHHGAHAVRKQCRLVR